MLRIKTSAVISHIEDNLVVVVGQGEHHAAGLGVLISVGEGSAGGADQGRLDEVLGVPEVTVELVCRPQLARGGGATATPVFLLLPRYSRSIPLTTTPTWTST